MSLIIGEQPLTLADIRAGAGWTRSPSNLSPGCPQGDRAQPRNGHRPAPAGQSDLWRQHRLRQARHDAYCAPPISRRCRSTSCARMRRASALRLPAAVVRLVMLLKIGASLAGRIGHFARGRRYTGRPPQCRHAAGHSGPRLGRRLRRSRAACAYEPGSDWRGPARPSRARLSAALQLWHASAASRSRSAPRKAWRFSTARRSRPRWHFPGCSPPNAMPPRRSLPAPCRSMPSWAPTRPSIRAFMRIAPASRPEARRRALSPPARRQPDPRLASDRR